jgi:MscS family membrane protein
MTPRTPPRRPFALRSASLAAVAAVIALLAASAAYAQSAPAAPGSASNGVTTATAAAEAARVDPDSPRVAWQSFSAACRRGAFEEAARWLDLPKHTAAQEGAELASQLDAVLRRYASLDDEDFSPRGEGDTADALVAGVDEIARIPHGANLGNDAVRLVRRTDEGVPRWVFSRSTVRSIHGWYETLDDRWIRPHLPKALLRGGPLDLLLWQWLALALVTPLVVLASRVPALLVITLGRRVLLRAFGASARLPSIVAPLQLLFASLASSALLRFLALDPVSHKFARGVTLSFGEIAVLWAVARCVDIFVERARDTALGNLPLFEAGLLPLIIKMTKLSLVIVGVIAALSNLGYQVGSLLAGLGIGGLAFALAAQKTVENLFGAAAIGLDQPFRIGDPVSIDGVKGVVEAVGIRSTRIRTEGRSIVSMPNAKVAEMRIENMAPRDRFLVSATLPIPLAALGKIPKLLERLDEAFEAHPDRLGEGHSATIARIGPAGFEVELKSYFTAVDGATFERLRHHLFLRVVAILDDMRIELTPSGGVFRLETAAEKIASTDTP